MRSTLVPLLFALIAACGGTEARDAGAPPPAADAGHTDASPAPVDAGVEDGGFTLLALPASPQRPGDPMRGYGALVNAGYIGCGVPYRAFRQVQGAAPMSLRLPGREGPNAELRYDFNAFTTSSSVSVVASNCLTCHASVFEGQVVVGLGDSTRDFTDDPSQFAELAGLLITDPAERAEWRKWADRIQAVGPFIQTKVIGVNPADNLAAVLFAHRDPETLAWSQTARETPPSDVVVPVDVPPWWRMKKKNAMFYLGAGQGDHARHMMTASVLCVDSVDEARAIDSYFPDVRAYIASLEAPPYPRAVDAAMADSGKQVFLRECSRCHGTYGEGGVYPNYLVSLSEVGTDPILAVGASQFVDRFLEWFEASFYGEISDLLPEEGYVAPPLDGVWLTAPFLHNGSVPDLETLLDSPRRPTYWTRSFDGTGYDYDRLGWTWTALDHGQAGEPDPAMRIRIYDTTLIGYSNGGHTFGDVLTDEERRAVIEYLKTL